MQQLGKRIFVETAYDWANVAAVVTDEGVVLIDSPVRPSDSKHWQNAVRDLHPKGVRYLITTDYHGDHVTGSAFIEGINDTVQFLAPQFVYNEVSKGGDNAFSKEIFVNTLRDLGHVEEADTITNAPAPLPRYCWEETMVLNLSPLTFHIKRCGGHSPATSAIFVPEERILFSSDLVFHSGGGLRDAHIGDWIKALDWITSLPIDTIVPGHGDVCGVDVAHGHKERLTIIRDAVAEVVQKGRGRTETIEDAGLAERFFKADRSRGEYWFKQRQETFREGIARIYDEVKGEV